METRLSTSSSDTVSGRFAAGLYPAIPGAWPRRPWTVGLAVQARPAARFLRALPLGALSAVAVVALIHFFLAFVVLPTPIARDELRQIVRGVTEHHRPRLVIAGDSRGRFLPSSEMAKRLGWSDADGANITVVSCGSTAVWLAYREFGHRFAADPIMVISVSLWSVNDGKPWWPRWDNELLWSVGFGDSLRVVSPGPAFIGLFCRETWLYDRAMQPLDALGLTRTAGRLAPPGEHGELRGRAPRAPDPFPAVQLVRATQTGRRPLAPTRRQPGQAAGHRRTSGPFRRTATSALAPTHRRH